MNKSKLGYKRNSPYKNEPSIQIDSNRITMDQVDFPILGIGDGGEVKMMYPGEEHLFPNSKKVTEIPMMQQGGKLGGFKAKWLKQKFQVGGSPNVQKAGNITFDSNTAKNKNGVLTVTDLETKKPVQVVRNTNGTYKLFEGTTLPTEEEYAKDFYTKFIQSPQYNEINKTKTKAQLTADLRKERPDLFTPEKATLLPSYTQGLDWDTAGDFEKNKQEEIHQVKNTVVKYEPSPEKKGSRYKRVDNTVYVDTKADKQFEPIDILTHELSHSKSSLPGMSGRNFSEKYRVSTVKDAMNPTITGHDSDPDEYKADINALRFKLSRDGYYDPLHNPFTKEILEKAKTDKVFQKNELFKRALKNSKSEDALIEALNSIVQNNQEKTTVAKSGGKIQSFTSKWIQYGR